MKNKDRELLELAAKAAGHEWKWDQPRGSRCGWLRVLVGDRWAVWNPFQNDGEAMLLAVKLHLCLLWPERQGRAYRVGAGQAGTERMPSFEKLGWGVDEAAATRRAIVCAAAEIGKELDQSAAPTGPAQPDGEK